MPQYRGTPGPKRGSGWVGDWGWVGVEFTIQKKFNQSKAIVVKLNSNAYTYNKIPETKALWGAGVAAVPKAPGTAAKSYDLHLTSSYKTQTS